MRMTNLTTMKKYKMVIVAWLYLITSSLVFQQKSYAQNNEDGEILDSLVNDTTIYAPGPLLKIKSENSTTAYSTVKGDILYKTPTANISNTMYGLLPGLIVTQASGQPGYDAASLYLRGLSSLNQGNITVFVDGFQTNFSYFQYLSPAEIESVSILKDAAALATFGLKGANGVLWVTTKKGRYGKPKVQLQSRFGLQQPTNINKPLSSADYATLYNEAYNNDNQFSTWQPYYSEATINDLRNGNGINTDWYAQTLKNSSLYTSTDVSIDGGNETARYFVLLGHMRNNGLYNVQNDETHSNAYFQQFNIRANLDFNLFNFFEGNVNIGGRTEKRNFPNYDGTNLWSNLARYPNIIYAPVNEDGSFPGTTVYPDNPYASIRELGYLSTHDRTLLTNVNLKEKLDFITPDLYLFQGASFNTWTRGTYRVSKDYARIINGQPQTTNQNTNAIASDDNGTNQWNWLQFIAGIGYNKTFGLNTINAAMNYLQYTYNVDANQNTGAGNNMRYGHQNFGGRIHYTYNDRLNAEFGFAYSGSDNYAPKKRFGFFPSLSAGYNIINEADNNDKVNFFKIRGSVGTSGNDYFSNGRYLYQKYYTWIGSYATGVDDLNWHGGLGPAYTPNANFFAEKSTKFNVGADATFLHKLQLTADVFMDKRSGIPITDNSISTIFGQPIPYVNAGKVTSKGFEVSAEYKNSIGKFTYGIAGNFSYAKSNIDFMDELRISATNYTTGRPLWSFIGYEFDGFYDISDFAADGSLNASLPTSTLGNVMPGDVKYKDLNGDNIIDGRDMTLVGNSIIPTINYAGILNVGYGGLNLRILLHGAANRSINLLEAANQIIAFENNGNAFAVANNRWAYFPSQNIDTRATATYPRLSLLGSNNNYVTSNLWVKDAGFLRLRNVELSYNFPSDLLRGTFISDARIFISAINPLTFSKILTDYNMDPEIQTGYTALKSYNIGFTVNF